jgi:uncharacterized protein YndB with AHSA1/START domain
MREPDLGRRPHQLELEREMKAPPGALYRAITCELDRWFAAPGSLVMAARVDAPFFFETEHAGERHPHYGRILALEPDRLVVMTWVTEGGTQGAETVLRIALAPKGSGTSLRLGHAGFASEAACERHREAWPMVLAHLDSVYASGACGPVNR